MLIRVALIAVGLVVASISPFLIAPGDATPTLILPGVIFKMVQTRVEFTDWNGSTFDCTSDQDRLNNSSVCVGLPPSVKVFPYTTNGNPYGFSGWGLDGLEMMTVRLDNVNTMVVRITNDTVYCVQDCLPWPSTDLSENACPEDLQYGQGGSGTNGGNCAFDNGYGGSGGSGAGGGQVYCYYDYADGNGGGSSCSKDIGRQAYLRGFYKSSSSTTRGVIHAKATSPSNRDEYWSINYGTVCSTGRSGSGQYTYGVVGTFSRDACTGGGIYGTGYWLAGLTYSN